MSRRAAWTSSDVSWRGGTAPYDLVKEAVVALVVVIVAIVVLAALFSSPDPKPVTVQSWARAAPQDFAATAAAELAGTSGTATYGPPYNANGTAQHLGFFRPAHWAGTTVPIDTARDFVLAPLRTLPFPAVRAAVATYAGAPPRARAAWAAAYARAAAKAHPAGARIVVPAGRYGPVAPMMSALYGMAAGGSLDGALQLSPRFYAFDEARRLLLLGDSGYVDAKATAENLNGDQWGIMNEVGQWPGAWWLAPYTAPYQFPPGSTSANGDLLVFVVVGGISLLFILLPWIPGLREIPRLIPIHRLIWREHYRRMAATR
jgi:hypothetical protein